MRRVPSYVRQRSLTIWSDVAAKFLCSVYGARHAQHHRVKDERAATAIEYGLIAAGIAVIIIPALTGVGSKLKTTFTTVQAALK